MNEERDSRKTSKKIAQVRSTRMVPTRVTLIDDEVFEMNIDKRACGQHLFEKVCEHLNLLEMDYFGLSYYNSDGVKYWVNNVKKLSKQIKHGPWVFDFQIKFYSPDPSMLQEDLTRYQLCLQVRKDMMTGKLPCSFVTYALLGSYTAQSELGDYDESEFGTGTDYLKEIEFSPKQDEELLERIADLHKTHKGQTPEEAEIHFLENAKKLAMYGMEIHQAKDAEGVDINLGICAGGLIVFKDKLAISRFVWPKILKISYRRNKFCIRIRPGEFESFQSMISFRLARVRLAKRLWKICVEHHSFFRFREVDPHSESFRLWKLGSKFRYSGRTQTQTKLMAASADRESPYFDRVHSKRATYHGHTPKRSLEREMYKRPPPRYENLPKEEPHDLKSDSTDEDPEEQKRKMEKMNAVPTPLASIGDGPDHDNHVNGPPGYTRDDPRDTYEESVEDDREYQIEQEPPVGPKGILHDDKERKRRQKEEKEQMKREKDAEKKRMKEEAKKKKAEEKERKAAEKAEKSKKGKKGKGKEKDWEEAVAVAVTADGEEVVMDNRHSDRLQSFEDEEKHDSDKEDLEKNERSIDVAMEPLSESTPIKGAPEETSETSPEKEEEKEVSAEETEEKERTENDDRESRGPVRELSM